MIFEITDDGFRRLAYIEHGAARLVWRNGNTFKSFGDLCASLANSRRIVASPAFGFGDFVMQVYLPFYKRKWKTSTAVTNEDRLRYHLTSGS